MLYLFAQIRYRLLGGTVIALTQASEAAGRDPRIAASAHRHLLVVSALWQGRQPTELIARRNRNGLANQDLTSHILDLIPQQRQQSLEPKRELTDPPLIEQLRRVVRA